MANFQVKLAVSCCRRAIFYQDGCCKLPPTHRLCGKSDFLCISVNLLSYRTSLFIPSNLMLILTLVSFTASGLNDRQDNNGIQAFY